MFTMAKYEPVKNTKALQVFISTDKKLQSLGKAG